MTYSEMKYLIAVHELQKEKHDVKLTEIAEKIGVTKVSVYRAAERLEKNGYIKRNERNKIMMTEVGIQSLSDRLELAEYMRTNLEAYCGASGISAHEDALGIVCALGEATREKLLDIIRTGK